MKGDFAIRDGRCHKFHEPVFLHTEQDFFGREDAKLAVFDSEVLEGSEELSRFSGVNRVDAAQSCAEHSAVLELEFLFERSIEAVLHFFANEGLRASLELGFNGLALGPAEQAPPDVSDLTGDILLGLVEEVLHLKIVERGEILEAFDFHGEVLDMEGATFNATHGAFRGVAVGEPRRPILARSGSLFIDFLAALELSPAFGGRVEVLIPLTDLRGVGGGGSGVSRLRSIQPRRRLDVDVTQAQCNASVRLDWVRPCRIQQR